MEGQTESSACWFTPQMLTMSRVEPMEAKNRELLLDFPCGCRGPVLWARLCCFSTSEAENWIVSGVAGNITGAHMGCGLVNKGLACYANMADPEPVLRLS